MAIAEISSALGAIKVTTDLIRGVMGADRALSEADLKFRLADAGQALLDARSAVLDAQALIEARDAEIAALKQALELKGTVVRRDGAYYDANDNGEPAGDGYCMRCFEEDHKLRHLAYSGSSFMDGDVKCQTCKSVYKYGAVYPRQPKQRAT